jgi:hypothetical protein
MNAPAQALLRGAFGALKLGMAWALLGPLLALATATAFGTLLGGGWPLVAQWLLHTLFFALLCGSWPVLLGDRFSPRTTAPGSARG